MRAPGRRRRPRRSRRSARRPPRSRRVHAACHAPARPGRSAAASSAPASRASWTCRAQIARRPSSSHSGAGGRGQPAPPEDVLHGDVALAKALRCLPQRRRRGGASVGDQQRQAVEQQVERARMRLARREGPGGAGDLRAGRPRRPGARRTPPRSRRSGRSRGPGPGRAARAAWRPSAAAGERRCPGPRRTRSARAAGPPGRCWNSSSGPASAVASSSRALPNAPACRLACAAASARSACRAGSAVSATARSRNAAAAASPPRACARPADRSSSAATSSSGPAAAWARCQARRSGSASGSVTSASAACTCCRSRERRRPVGRRAHQRMPEPHPGAELDQARLHRRRRRLDRDAQPPGRPPHQRPVTGRIGRRQLQQPPGLVGQGVQLPGEAVLDPAGQRRRAGQPEPARQLRRASARAAAPAAPADSPASRRRSGRGPARPAARPAPSPAAPARRRPAARPTSSSGSPASSAPGSRAANTSPTGSAASRRATNPSACAEARSSHCSSSTRQISGRSPATSGQQAQHGQPDQEPVRRRPRGDAERGPQRVPLRHRQPLERGPASARTADAARRTPAPSPTARPPRAPPGTRPTPARPGSPAAPSCPRPDRRAPPGPGSHRPGPRRPAGPARRVRRRRSVSPVARPAAWIRGHRPALRRFPVAWLGVGAHTASRLVQITGPMRPGPAATSTSGATRGGCRSRPRPGTYRGNGHQPRPAGAAPLPWPKRNLPGKDGQTPVWHRDCELGACGQFI